MRVNLKCCLLAVVGSAIYSGYCISNPVSAGDENEWMTRLVEKAFGADAPETRFIVKLRFAKSFTVMLFQSLEMNKDGTAQAKPFRLVRGNENNQVIQLIVAESANFIWNRKLSSLEDAPKSKLVAIEVTWPDGTKVRVEPPTKD